MNKQGQVAALVFMISIVIVILAMAFVKPINEMTTTVMNESYVDSNGAEHLGMNCTTTTDDFVKAGCWITDINQAYFIGGILAIAGIVIGARLAWGG